MRFLLFSKRKIDVLLSKLVFVGNTNEYVSHTSYVIVVYTVYGQILRGGETILGGEIPEHPTLCIKPCYLFEIRELNQTDGEIWINLM